jgi:ATP-dependent DNA helicase RecQ
VLRSEYGIDRAVGITSELTSRQAKEAAYEGVLGGENFFYYVAPERFQIKEFRKALRAMKLTVPIALIAVDEAHCVSEWGHDFRTSYLRLADNARACCTSGAWTPPVLALTGTASRTVLKDLQRELRISDYDAVITPKTFDRKELDYVVVRCSSDEKPEMLKALLGRHLPGKLRIPPESLGGLNGPDTKSGLVFCPWAGGEFGVGEVASIIRSTRLSVQSYAGKKPADRPGNEANWSREKRVVERDFKRNKFAVLACTKAFGMGIDKRNIRYTVHYSMPPSIEAFYQEAGRAGRDRKKSVCCLLVSDDFPQRNEALLAPSNSVEEIQRAMAGCRRDENDDITRVLFFQARAFRGVDKELSALAEVVAALAPLDKEHRCVISPAQPRGEDGDDPQVPYEKALHRLVILGVVADYTVEYAQSAYDVRVAGPDRASMIASYVDYVGTYQTGRALQERAKAESIVAYELSEFVLELGRLYLQFVYDVIEKGRRRAIAEMRAASMAADERQFRARILRYLEATEFSEKLDSILESADAGLPDAIALRREIISPRDADSIRGQVARYLESYPDQPALLWLRAMSEALARGADWVLVRTNLEAFLRNAATSYACPSEHVMLAGADALRVLVGRETATARIFERGLLETYPGRDDVRTLVRAAGLDAARQASWALLDELARKATDMCTTIS